MQSLFFRVFLLFSLLYFLGCKKAPVATFVGNLPVDSTLYVDIYQSSTGKNVASESIRNRDLKIKLDSAYSGIYTIVVSWNRDVMRPAEMKNYARSGRNELPKYLMSDSFWLDATETMQYDLSIAGAKNQIELEQALLYDSHKPKLKVSAEGDNFILYQRFVKISALHSERMIDLQDSLKKELVVNNELGDFGAAKVIHDQLKVLEDKGIAEDVVRDEVKFLIENRDNPIIPALFCSLVHSQEAFKLYQTAYNMFTPEVKKSMAKQMAPYLR
ncbi:hypothetical protein [Sphingobacterium sp. LRF_L2]|uniref:hypothetical protein n=1 Tax=Sphingobacterium sp. LRF_L2 TaxID=3369421 RepID=UPI003F62C9A5